MDADATLCSPMLVAVADGVSQIEEFGIDASELPSELLSAVETLAEYQLLPGLATEPYLGPINMIQDAWEATESFGSTTVLTAAIDNSTKIHGKLHPMIAVCSIGDCEILILRTGIDGRRRVIFRTEMQRINGDRQSPLQLARVDETVDPNFDPNVANEVIEDGSAVHCVSAVEGDIVVAGSDGVFDNLFVDEIVNICEDMIPNQSLDVARFQPVDEQLLTEVARQIVLASHAKTQPFLGKYPETPIGLGGKIDDTSCVVAQVVEWTEAYSHAWTQIRSERRWRSRLSCCDGMQPIDEEDSAESAKQISNISLAACAAPSALEQRGACSLQ